MSEEKKKQVTAGDDDVNSIRGFIKHFNLTMPERLEQTLQSFEKEKTFENQEAVRRALAEFVTNEPSGLFQDKMFAPLATESKKVQYYESFEENLTELLDKEENS